jgi:hypothetical protein
MINLNEFGSASRCLLRLRENQGQPVMSDQRFIEHYRDRFPLWAARPGELDAAGIRALASELEVAGSVARTDDYDSLVEAFAAGHDILVLTETAPLQIPIGLPPHPTTSLIVTMDPQGMSIWWPEESGQGGILPRAGRTWWKTWQASGLILRESSSQTSAGNHKKPEYSNRR